MQLSARLGRRSRRQRRPREADRRRQKVLDWLLADEALVYHRVHALQESLCAGRRRRAGSWPTAPRSQSRRHGDPLPRQLRDFLHDWATVDVPEALGGVLPLRTRTASPWLDANDLNAFARYLRDYLLTETVFAELSSGLTPVVNLKTRDEAARRRARRKYVRIILNDY